MDVNFNSRYGVTSQAGGGGIVQDVDAIILEVEQTLENELKEIKERLEAIQEGTDARENQIINDLDIIYDRALCEYERAKVKIIDEWQRVEGQNSWLNRLGFDFTLNFAMATLRDWKKKRDEKESEEKQFDKKIEEERSKLNKEIESLQKTTNWRLAQLEGYRDSIGQYTNNKSNGGRNG